MSSKPPPCHKIKLYVFRGDRTPKFVAAFLTKLGDEKHHRGVGPTEQECLRYAGHAGVSTDDGTSILGFNPDRVRIPLWQLMDGLRNGDAFPGIVRDDTQVFNNAKNHGLIIQSFDLLFPKSRFDEYRKVLDGERKNSQYTYGFPNGDGDCNCITWLERIGLPLLTGRMDDFIGIPGTYRSTSRRFGKCS